MDKPDKEAIETVHLSCKSSENVVFSAGAQGRPKKGQYVASKTAAKIFMRDHCKT